MTAGPEEGSRLTYIPDHESVRPSRPLPPAAHSGEGPVLEAVGVPGGRREWKTWRRGGTPLSHSGSPGSAAAVASCEGGREGA